MRIIKSKLPLFVSFILIIISCNDDAVVVNSIPEFTTLEENISSLPGEDFIFEGIVSDPAGIKSVNFTYEPWFLNKTIVKDSLPETYEISYRFKIPDDAIPNSIHTIPMTVSNAGDKTTVKNITITLDRDIENPVINIASPVNGATVLIGTADEVNLNITVTDKNLAEFKIESSVLNETLAISGSSFEYEKALNITEPDTYTFTITVTDTSGNVSTETVSMNVLNELSFDVMYITGVTSEALLVSDIFGIPYVTSASEVAEEDGFVFIGRYYSPAPNTEVRFLAQKGSFGPYTFGVDTNTDGRLALGDDVTVSPIVLPEVGYYEVKMDLRDSSYSVTSYMPTDDPYTQIYILGRGIYIDDTVSTCTDNTTNEDRCWHFRSGKPFTKDPNNSYLWTIDVTVKDHPNDDGVNGFILNANPASWAPFWRVDNVEDPEATVPGGGGNYVFPDSALDKDYTFTFDTHLNRISATIR
ncbi:hypothetical protein [uncultured Polaribacter sp.]|uniref:hypothetical protein n=1 Tax=uncultured Polaribacter sp. TaxID=174711 RepID=UPI0026181DAC|nr:hypothetical protein [uncultured Polaribacter sp.]